jgi:4-amino-4-deoxy-L-arabinose transferase-like glycosyltransferase
MLMTTDAPLLFCWALLLYGLHHALRAPGRAGWWLLCGVALGGGFLAKYTMLLALPCIALAAGRVPALRQALRAWPPYAALRVAALLATPVLVWNVQHHWVSVRHVGTLTGLATPLLFTPVSPWKFIGGQLGVVTPALLALIVLALVQVWRTPGHSADADRSMYWCFSAPALLFFTLLSFYTDVEANWAAPAYIGALVLVAMWLGTVLTSPARGGGPRWGLLALLLVPGWTINAAAHLPSLLPSLGIVLPARLDPTARLAGWADLGAAVGRVRAREPGAFLMSESYQVASALAFYTPGQPRVYNINLGRRMNQYDLWGGLDDLIGRDGLYITAGRWDASHPIRVACATLEPVEVIDVWHHGQIARTFSVLRCGRYGGMPAAGPIRY